MVNHISDFEKIVRKSYQFSDAKYKPTGGLHPFDERNIHPKISLIVKALFDNGHYPQSTFEAYKFIDNEIQRQSSSTESGFKLMMKVFDCNNPLIRLNPLNSISEKDEQKGFQFIFAGSMLAIRNPRGHDYTIIDSPDNCLDHLSLASLLLRRIEEAGYK